MRANRRYKNNKDWEAAKVDPKVFLLGAVIGLVIMIGIGTVMGKELVNTATNEIAEVQDMGKRDVLEDIYRQLDQKGQDTETIFIVEEAQNDKVTLLAVEGYAFEDYEDAGFEPKEVAEYDSLMDLLN